MKITAILIGVLYSFISCSQNVYEKGYIYAVKTEPFKGLTSFRRVYYTFNYQDSIYKGNYRFGRLDTYYMEKDSVWVIFSKNKPEESKLEGIIFRPEREVKPITKSEGANIILHYDIAHKPQFFGCETFEESQQKIEEQVYDKTKRAGFSYTGTVTLSIVVSEEGEIESCKILSSSKDKELDNFIIKTILDIPKGIAGKDQNGNNRKVSFLLYLDFDSYTEQAKAYVYLVKNDSHPQGDNQVLWRIYYRFIYHGSTHENSFRIGGDNPLYSEQDSVLVVFPENKPEKSVVKGITYRLSPR